MRYIRPDFYDDFKCLADKCRHSCCIGWEIDIDDDSLDYYMSLDGEIGRQLRENIELEPEAHFHLREKERCPFLEENGLCSLIRRLGEESLCDICAEHPRFYNCFGDREEAGLGLCCEEAARLLLEGEGSLKLIAEGGSPDDDEIMREKLFELLSNPDKSLFDRFGDVLTGQQDNPNLTHWAEFLLNLERLDDRWTDKLLQLQNNSNTVDLAAALEHDRYMRLCQYFVYRHLLTADDCALTLEFCFLATEIIAALDAISGFDIENTRLFSSEIEYSDENISLILEEIKKIR